MAQNDAKLDILFGKGYDGYYLGEDRYYWDMTWNTTF
jgi:hypothetical protein